MQIILSLFAFILSENSKSSSPKKKRSESIPYCSKIDVLMNSEQPVVKLTWRIPAFGTRSAAAFAYRYRLVKKGVMYPPQFQISPGRSKYRIWLVAAAILLFRNIAARILLRQFDSTTVSLFRSQTYL